MKMLTLSALALAAMSSAAPALATTFVSGQVSANAQASLGSDASPGDPQHQDLPGVPNFLSVNSRFDTARGGDSIAVIGIINAFWTSADEGNLNVHNAWDVELPASDITTAIVGAAPILNGQPDWTYKFTADADGAFAVDYSVAVSGDVFGFGVWEISVLDPDGVNKSDLLTTGPSEPGVATGTFTQALFAGHTYTISLNSLDSIGFFGTAAGKRNVGADDDSFSWRITSNAVVPEPSTWMLTILGFGLLGAVLRRRRVASYAT